MLNNQEKELLLLEDLGMLYPNKHSKTKRRHGIYLCHCGNKFKVRSESIRTGNTKSCGCSINKTHGMTKHRLYSVWHGMKQRCYNENDKRYMDWGGRGIKICDLWHNVENFIIDMYPSFKEGLSIDRIDYDGNYEKSNCRWATREIQARNTRKLQSNNTSGYRGVTWHERDNKFGVSISVNNKSKWLGYFNTALEGAKAYDKYVIDNDLEHTKNF